MEKTIILSPGQSSAESLGFNAKSCIVQNNTPVWWYLPDIQHFVPPFVSNHVITLVGAQVANIQYSAPVGMTQPIASSVVSGLTTAFRYLDTEIPPALGAYYPDQPTGAQTVLLVFTAGGPTQLDIVSNKVFDRYYIYVVVLGGAIAYPQMGLTAVLPAGSAFAFGSYTFPLDPNAQVMGIMPVDIPGGIGSIIRVYAPAVGFAGTIAVIY